MPDHTMTSLPLQTVATNEQEADLWPDKDKFGSYELTELPVDILRAQAAFLAGRTDYCLKGIVRSSNMQDDVIYHSFYVYAPYVREEPFKLFYLKHSIHAWDDITLVWGDAGPLTDKEFGKANNPEELRNKIREILASDTILRVIGNLLALSKSAKASTVSFENEDEELDPETD